MKRLTVLALLPAVALFATGCGQSDSVEPPATELAGVRVVFVWSETGGCAQGGPNCARYEVAVDGTVETFRVAGADEAAEPAATGQVDPALVQDWRDAVADEDLDALRARAGEGEMAAAFDGIDFLVINPVTGVELSSVLTDFDETEPVFATAFALARAAATVAPLELQMR